MSGIVIKPFDMQKMLVEQQTIHSSLSVPPERATMYLNSPPAVMTSVYHSRGCVCTQEAQDQTGPDPRVSEEAPLLGALMNATPRLNLDLEKALDLTCRVLDKARSQSSDMSDKAREHMCRLVELGNQFAQITAPPE